MDYSKKLFKYNTTGVREYWIVDFEIDFTDINTG